MFDERIYFVIFALHCGAVHTADSVFHQTGNKALTDEWGGTWKEPIVSEVKVLSKYLTERNHKIPVVERSFRTDFINREVPDPKLFTVTGNGPIDYPLILQKGVLKGS